MSVNQPLVHAAADGRVLIVKRQGLGELIQAAEERLGRETPLMKTYGKEGGEDRTEVV